MRKRLFNNNGGGVIPDIEIESIFFPEGQLHVKNPFGSNYAYISSFQLIIGAVVHGVYLNDFQEERLYVNNGTGGTQFVTPSIFREAVEIYIDPYYIDGISNLIITLGSITKDDNTEIKRQITSIDSRSDYGIGGIPLGNGNNPTASIILNKSNQFVLQFDFDLA